MADGDGERKKKRRWWRKRDAATDVAEGAAEGVLEGCFGCNFIPVIALALVAGIPVLLGSL